MSDDFVVGSPREGGAPVTGGVASSDRRKHKV